MQLILAGGRESSLTDRPLEKDVEETNVTGASLGCQGSNRVLRGQHGRADIDPISETLLAIFSCQMESC